MIGVKGFPDMYPQATIDEIRELLAKSWTQRAIAKKLDVSRGLVSNIAAGGPKPRKRRTKTVPIGQRPLKFEAIPPTRCPRCGALVVTSPCIACYLRTIGSPKPVPDLDE